MVHSTEASDSDNVCLQGSQWFV